MHTDMEYLMNDNQADQSDKSHTDQANTNEEDSQSEQQKHSD